MSPILAVLGKGYEQAEIIIMRQKIELYFILILFAISLLLFFKVTMYKTEYYGLDTNPIFSFIKWILLGCLFIFNYKIIKYKIWINIIITILISTLSNLTASSLIETIIEKFVEFENQTTPYGWQFKYKWFELLLIGICMVILTEITFKINRRTIIKN